MIVEKGIYKYKHQEDIYIIVLDISNYIYYFAMRCPVPTNEKINTLIYDFKTRNIQDRLFIFEQMSFMTPDVFTEDTDGFLGTITEKNAEFLKEEFKKSGVYAELYKKGNFV